MCSLSWVSFISFRTLRVRKGYYEGCEHADEDG